MKIRKAIFLDIDGVVVYDPRYLSQSSQLHFLPGSVQALKKAQEKGFFLVFISNKGGAFVKRGLTKIGLQDLDKTFKKLLEAVGIRLENLVSYYCIHYQMGKKGCICRKPATGLFERAINEYNIETKDSYAIGDKITDLIPATALGIKKAILVKRNQQYFDIGKREDISKYLKFESLKQAMEFIQNIP